MNRSADQTGWLCRAYGDKITAIPLAVIPKSNYVIKGSVDIRTPAVKWMQIFMSVDVHGFRDILFDSWSKIGVSGGADGVRVGGVPPQSDVTAKPSGRGTG